VNFHWSDVGSWHAVWTIAAKDAAGNTAQGRALFLESNRCFVASDKPLVAMLGVENLVVIANEDAVLVANRDRTADMKQLVTQLKAVAPAVTEEHLKAYRPWGSYQSLDQGDRYQVKRIVVRPNGRLSLQKHYHRAEHWVVVRGTAQVTINESKKTLHENESVYIPIGALHRLENPGKIDLELIEVQSGSYLGEDDIVRFDDDYHRSD
jgi:mannose-1-phosphate guanylyltransferase/mannose-6-phosphate isomerase